MEILLKGKIKELEGGRFTVVASTEETDRVGDRINPGGWYLENYMKNPVMLWAHDSSSPPVAKATKVWIENGKLMVEGTFAPTPLAQELRVLVENGFLNAVSVGFMPLMIDEKGIIEIEGKLYRRMTDEEVKKSVYEADGEYFERQELLEVSWVGVPALPQALVTARKMNLQVLTKALEKMEVKEEGKEEGKEEDKKTEKSPACRLAEETADECVARKIPELVDEGMEQDQAVAAAINICETACEAKDNKDINLKEGRIISEKNRGLIRNCLKQMGEAKSALEDLLEATEPEKGACPEVEKGRDSLKKDKSNKNAELELLRIANKVIETLLLKQRQK